MPAEAELLAELVSIPSVSGSEQAIAEFEAILSTDPGYGAAYYHGGQTLEKLGRLDEAREFYRRGLSATSDPHALGELQAALGILGD